MNPSGEETTPHDRRAPTGADGDAPRSGGAGPSPLEATDRPPVAPLSRVPAGGRGDLDVMRRLMDDGLSAGEAARVVRDARRTLDTITETVQLAAARILAENATDLEAVAAEYRSTAELIRRTPSDAQGRKAA